MRGSAGGAHPSPSSSDLVQAFARFLIRHHSPELRSILLSPDPILHYSLVVDFAEFLEFDPPLAHLLFSQPGALLSLFDQAAQLSQVVVLDGSEELKCEASLKEFVHVRINVSGSPLECPETFPRIGRLRVKHRGFLLTVKGTVIRCGAVKMIEGEREYMCRKCKYWFKVHPEMENRNMIRLPTSCPSKEVQMNRIRSIQAAGPRENESQMNREKP